MKIEKKSILPKIGLTINQKLDYEGFDFSNSYPVVNCQDFFLEGTLKKEKDYIKASFSLKGTATLLDSYTNEAFDKNIELIEDFDILENEDQVGEGYIEEGLEIDLESLCLKLLKTSLPIKVLKPGSKLPESGEGYRVYHDQEAKEVDGGYNPAFDALKDFDPDSDK